MSDRNQEPGEAAGPASGEEAAAVRDGRSGDAGRAEAASPPESAATADPAGAGGRVGGEPADGGQQQAEGVPPREQRGAEGPPVHERAVGTERGAGDTADRVNADDSAGRAGDQDREQRGGAEAAVAGSAETTVPAEGGEGRAALFAGEERDRLGGQWDAVQAAFVDDPRAAVERADALVAEVVQSLTTSFTGERSRLEQQWSQGEDVSTEDLRQALHRYRSFFERLLHV